MCKSNCCACCCCCKCNDRETDMKNIRKAFEKEGRNKVVELEDMCKKGHTPGYHVLLKNLGYFNERYSRKSQMSCSYDCLCRKQGRS